MATLLKANGESQNIIPENGSDFQLEELHKAVGGYIEIIYLQNGKIMVINEEGKLMNLPENGEATTIAHNNHAIFDWDFICGDVLLCKNDEVR